MTLYQQDSSVAQAIEGLNDIVMPEPISTAPQTIGWVLVLAVAIVLLGVVVVAARRRHRRNAYRREALALVESVPLTGLPALVKRVALAAAPRTEVASLTGEAWLKFLDATYGGTEFTQGPGRLLATLSFAPARENQQPSADDLRALVAKWVRQHRV